MGDFLFLIGMAAMCVVIYEAVRSELKLSDRTGILRIRDDEEYIGKFGRKIPF